MKTSVFQRKHAGAKGDIFCSGNYQKMHKRHFFKRVRIKFQKQVSEVQKNWRTNAWHVDLGVRMAKLIFIKKCVLAPEEVFFLVTLKRCS